MEHSQSCIEAKKKRDEEIKEFDIRFPHVCKACSGTGMRGSYEHLDDRGAIWIPDVCGCADDGKCPLCGEYALNDDGKCSSCGFDIEHVKHVRPPEYECLCYEDWEITQ